mmetsp:Transcript_35746/g.70854  ORF Transcript_35746/g.70854 Transcript_35746/m.70854 type:complete len:245 (-) Transcript_35746:125-859(-)|eukprot:CAMPEP_0172675192 /NCGR_PEP_ID=MMETSP1074-20121228/13134_1 /TAXON_ID=2916 /ORGANISM="Ceratium fusus, Strain PA161109" /LENGTH=244 /DNA_ID=CAMNT_0013492641 /DNA_START=53 /DNA_END=787 /DNA_ORIENTATION=+
METTPRAFDLAATALPASDRLDERLTASHGKLVRWRQESARSAQLELRRCIQGLRQERADLENLRLGVADTERLLKDTSVAKAWNAKLEEAACQFASVATKQAEAANSARVQICETHRAVEEELGREEEALAARRCSARVAAQGIEQLLGLYRERLGLAISRAAPQTVQIAFTLLDQEEPSREFSLTLGLASSEGYCVLDCSPPVLQLGHLLARLNSNAEAPTALPAFVVGMRKEFKRAARTRM